MFPLTEKYTPNDAFSSFQALFAKNYTKKYFLFSIFLKKLRTVYTNLTIDEQKLALHLEFGCSDSAIISILRLNHGEYESYKNDLRIKLNLTEHADIANFLKSI